MIDLYPSRCAQETQILPRRDPVLHGNWTPDAPLSREEARRFEEEGYLVLEDIFSSEEVAFLQNAAGALLADPAALEAETVVAEPGSRDIRSVFRIHAQSRAMARLAADARLAGIARFLLGDDIYLHQSRLNSKPGFQGKSFYWHSDFETWHVEDGMPRMRALSMSVILTENTPFNGPLMLIPGSHRAFVTCLGETPENHYRTSLRRQEYGVPDEESLARLAARHGIVAQGGKPGTIILFDCNMMHGSNSNITPFPRANAFFVYNAISNRLQAPYGTRKPRPSFIAARGVPEAIVPRHGLLLEETPA